MVYDMAECGKRIRLLRISRKMTQELLANQLNITTDHLGKIECGKRGCSIDVFVDLVNFFDVSMDFLLFGCEARNESARKEITKIIYELEALRESV